MAHTHTNFGLIQRTPLGIRLARQSGRSQRPRRGRLCLDAGVGRRRGDWTLVVGDSSTCYNAAPSRIGEIASLLENERGKNDRDRSWGPPRMGTTTRRRRLEIDRVPRRATEIGRRAPRVGQQLPRRRLRDDRLRPPPVAHDSARARRRASWRAPWRNVMNTSACAQARGSRPLGEPDVWHIHPGYCQHSHDAIAGRSLDWNASRPTRDELRDGVPPRRSGDV